MQAFECTGQWWLPQNEKDRAAGTLKVSASGELRLWLLGQLGPGEKAKGHPIILGWVDESPLGDIVTLSGCALGGSTASSATNLIRENYHASRAYFGEHLLQQTDFVFSAMTLRLAGLSQWAHNYTGILNEAFPAGKIGEPASVLSYSYNMPMEAKIPGGRLVLSTGLGSRQSHRERSFHEDVVVSLSCETAKSSAQLNADYVYPLQNLMTFVCDRPQPVDEFIVRSGEFPQAGREIRVIAPTVHPEVEGDPPEQVQYFQMLFTLADVDFSDFVERWLVVTKTYEAACTVYFGIQYGPPAYLDMIFPSFVQAIYLYFCGRDDGVAARADEEKRLKEILSVLPVVDAEWIVDRLTGRPFPPLQFVLRKLVEEHSDTMNPLVSHRQDRFVSEVINTLKYIVLRDADMALTAQHGASLHWMMQRLRFLFKSCLLRELGFKKELIHALFDRNAQYRHVCAVEEAMEQQRRQQA